MKIGYKRAYFRIEDRGKGMYSGERVIKSKDYHGKILEGFFDKNNIHNGRLKVTVIEKEKDLITVITPNLFFGRTSIIGVKESDLVFE